MNKVIAFGLGLLSMVVVHSTAGAAETAGGVCVNDSARKELTACPGAGPKEFDVGKHGKQPQVNFRGVAPLDAKKKGEIKPGAPTESVPRDERKSRLQARARALLVTEIQGLESLFQSTPRSSPDRVELARRLSEDYVELESAAFKEKTQAEIDRDNLKKANPAAAGQKQTVANDAARIMNGARTKAETYYALIKNEYPNYSKLDEVLYYLAYEYEQSNDNANARKVYLELINKRPDSKYVPHAYLAFGELFFNEAMGDPSKWDLAAQAYTEVIKYPPEKNKVYGYAWYKLGYVFWNQSAFEKALNAFKKTIDWGMTYKEQPGATKLAEAARKDTIPVYALKGNPAAAYNYFHNISGDPSGSDTNTYKMMDELGINYLDTGHYPEAITLYRDLMARDRNGDKHCVYQAHITEATLAMKASQKDSVKAELDNQLKNYSEFKNANHPADAKHECANKTAALLTETGMAWHLEAVGSQGQRGTGDQKAMTLAAYLYKKIGETWTAQDFASFEFPRIVKEDWPTIYKIRYAMADLLYFQQRWAECGPAFDAVVAENPTAPEAPEAAYASVLCYQNIYETTHKGGEDRKGMGNAPGQAKTQTEAQKKAEETARLQPKPLTDNQKGMITAFNRYICYIKPVDKTGQDQLVEVKYARARTYFEAQHWEEAAAAFREIAMQNADKDVGIYAAQLYLESINVIGSHSNPPRPSCYDDMQNDVPKFVELYCTGENEKKNADQCVSLTKVQCDIQRLKAQKLVELADKGGPNAVQTYEQAGSTYIELWRRYGEAPISQGQPAQCERVDEILYNAAKAFQAARLIGKAITTRRTLLDPRYKMDKSDLARRATYEIGGNYQAIAVYDQAADWFEKFAKENPKYEKADQALSDATVLRLGLGDEEAGIRDADMFRKNYGASKPTQAAAIAFAIGAHYAEKEDWDKAQKALEGSIGYIDRSAAPDIQAQAHATLARSYTKVRHQNRDRAQVDYARVRKIWDNPAEAVKKINDAYPNEDEAQKQKRVGKALNAVGEAYFYAAEELKRETVDKVKFPVYRGSGSKEDVSRHINTRVKDWLEKKGPAIEKAAAEYKKIVDLQPDAPPKWVIAAGSRVGLMWGDFVDEFRRAPIPEAWKKDAEMQGVYYDQLDAKSEPIKVQRAKPALVTCLSYSVKFQYFDDYSRSCEVWLAKNYKAEYHVVDELRGAPTLSNSGLDDKAPPLTIGGMIWHPQNTGPAEKVAATMANSEEGKDAAAGKKGGGGADKGGAGKAAAGKAAGGGGGGGKPPKGAIKPLPGQGKKK
ncbi:tetratricopeptide repeat protein [Pendulispora albinea]|uniref:Tetratricopeptide repeat protein n=1 Tax=Pendulispora albinea TaxID=2741071 RepID=A0ABZ2M5K7_9BACT